jgi:hypothetical protein
LGEAASAAAALGMADSLPRPQESSNHFANATLDVLPGEVGAGREALGVLM